MDVDGQDGFPPQGDGSAVAEEAIFDAAVDLAEAPKSKRARVGRPHTQILGDIEDDAASLSGWQRHLRGLLLHVGASRRYEEGVQSVLRRQGDEVLTSYRGHGDAAIDIIFEA
jgi:hypothetical protein